MNSDIKNSLSKSSQAQYKKYWNEYKSFHYNRFSKHIRNMTAKHVQLFVTYLNNFRKLSVSSIRCYLSGIAFYTKLKFDCDPTKSYGIKLLLRAFGKRQQTLTTIRKPIGKKLVNKLCEHVLRSNLCTYSKYAYAVMYNLMYNAALRVGELCQSGSANNHIIKYNQIIFDKQREHITIQFKSYKHSDGATPNLEIKCGRLFWRILRKYIALRGDRSGPFACHENNTPFTRVEFVHQLKNQLRLLNHNVDHYNTHSFRIGKATDMHTLGASNSQIEKIGRWRTNAFKKYIRPSTIYT